MGLSVLHSPALSLVAALLVSLPANAQSPAAAKPAPVPPAQPAMKIGPVTVQGSFRSRVEMWDWFQPDTGSGSYAYSGNILRVSFSQALERFDWQVELAAPFLLGLPDEAIAPGEQGQLGLGATYYAANNRSRNTAMVFPKQAFLRVKNLFGDGSQSVRIGRFELSDGAEVAPKDASLAWVKRDRISQRLIGPFGWSHVGRSFDGVHYVYNKGATNFTFVGALPTRGAFQTDGWGNLKIGLGYAALTRSMQKGSVGGDYRVFGIYYHDWRRVLKTDNRPLALRRTDMGNIRIGSFGGHALNTFGTRAGVFDTMVWGLGQFGRWGALDHGAFGYALEAGWQPKGLQKLRPWVRAGWSHTSGDSNPLDGDHGTFFQFLPTPRPFARFPFFDMINNEDLFGMLLLRPHKAVTVRPEVHWLRLAHRADQWYLGGGAFQPWTFGYVGRPSNGRKGLADLYDVSADWNVNARLTLTGYAGYAAGDGVIDSIYPRGKNGAFGYLEAVYRF